MKYADYKIENLVFMKGTDGWSIEEKKEFLDTCPENEGLSKTIEDLKELNTAIIDGVVKRNTYGEINKNSLKAYINKHDVNILYGKPNRRYYYLDDGKDFYILADGSYATISRGWDVTNLIEKYTEDKYIETRFDTLARSYEEKEDKWSKNVESDRYKATHGDQIKANKKLDKLMDSLRIEVPVGLETDTWGYTTCKTSKLSIGDYWFSHNEYGEITINKTPFTEDQAVELTEVVMEMSQKISAIIDEYRPTFDKAFGKKGA